jgi:hypothetical protein
MAAATLSPRPPGARIHTSRSSSVVRITGIVFGWIGSTTAFAHRSEGVKAPFASLSFRT